MKEKPTLIRQSTTTTTSKPPSINKLEDTFYKNIESEEKVIDLTKNNSKPKRKIKKAIRGKKRLFVSNTPDLRDYGLPEPVRKVYANKDRKRRIKFGTRVVPKTIYDPLNL